MIKLFLRLVGLLASKFIKTDKLSVKFPISVKGVIENEKGYLLLKNERDEWDFPGGKLESGESVQNTLIREFNEETSLNISVQGLSYAELSTSNDVEVVVLIYMAKVIDTNPIELSFEHHEYDFFSKSEIAQLKTPSWVDQLMDIIT